MIYFSKLSTQQHYSSCSLLSSWKALIFCALFWPLDLELHLRDRITRSSIQYFQSNNLPRLLIFGEKHFVDIEFTKTLQLKIRRNCQKICYSLFHSVWLYVFSFCPKSVVLISCVALILQTIAFYENYPKYCWASDTCITILQDFLHNNFSGPSETQ